jgi:L-aspartate oxidase
MADASHIEADLAVAGAGAAGLFTALTAARLGARVVLVSATPLAQTASYWAQGGLAAALAHDDSIEQHIEDTLLAGRGIVRYSAAEQLCREAPDRVHELERLGVRFDVDRRGRLSLGLEGGHSQRRVVHASGSATGRRVVRQLSALVAENPLVEVVEGARAQSLSLHEGRCIGVGCDSGLEIAARAVVISSGGAAALWRRTTNPPGSVGTGVALAHAAGAAVADLEFCQFHPTAVTGIPGREGFLVTEAIRGEGATLHDSSGERFVQELLPRDEVASAIFERLRATGATSVGLDMRAVDPARFPNVVAALRESGLDATRELIPVAPAAHYMMGGIVTDLDARSTIAGLYAVGEAACTGLHGANRLASNSLSECFVFGRRAAERGLDEPALTEATPDTQPAVAPEPPSAQTREAMWSAAGLERRPEDLQALAQDPHPLARLVARCALARQESRGAHRRVDYLELDPALDGRHGVVRGEAPPTLETWE